MQVRITHIGINKVKVRAMSHVNVPIITNQFVFCSSRHKTTDVTKKATEFELWRSHPRNVVPSTWNFRTVPIVGNAVYAKNRLSVGHYYETRESGF